jgi:methylmalonyl-CoA mutase
MIPGVSWMFANLCRLLREKMQLPEEKWTPQMDTSLKEPRATVLIPGARTRYLAEIAEQGRGINRSRGVAKRDRESRAELSRDAAPILTIRLLPKALDLSGRGDRAAGRDPAARDAPVAARRLLQRC